MKAAQAASSSTVDNEVIYSSNRTDKVNIMAQLRLQWRGIFQPQVGMYRDLRSHLSSLLRPLWLLLPAGPGEGVVLQVAVGEGLALLVADDWEESWFSMVDSMSTCCRPTELGCLTSWDHTSPPGTAGQT